MIQSFVALVVYAESGLIPLMPIPRLAATARVEEVGYTNYVLMRSR